jgi:hypothetical protein
MREIVLTPRRALAAGLLGGLASLALRRPAAGQATAQPVLLFRVIGPRDTITIGITPDDLAAWGSGEPVSVLAARLAAAGQVTAWAYAVGRGEDGALAMVSRGRVALLRNDTLRIEPYAAAHPVRAPLS